ncbi:proline-rich protein HaeIII subfamily 1-like isoform X2 [Molothrus ater]|uniref:proline-rich protein HaeIII subfamily 1-like isoform X2 n=1 Tax=Molothrus ater TaxID=84834 RepID=UPI0017485019|nr:proline-rich protein HaeIII subfamily 1-like isoform X2 [Molothrus ater]
MSPVVLSLPLSFLASLSRPKAAYPFSQRGVFLPRPGPGGLRRRAGGGGPDPAAPRTLPWPDGICPPCLQTGKRRRGAEPSPSPEMTQPLFQHRLPFGLAPFQKPSPSTPFFPAFLLPPPPRLTVTLKQPPPPPHASLPPAAPNSFLRTVGCGHLPLILIQRSCFWNWCVRLWCLPAEEEEITF